MAISPTINLSADSFLSLSLERTPPRRDLMMEVALRRRSARDR